jgi:alkylation response protein AidB-like acyl-CoA dehydrogenase
MCARRRREHVGLRDIPRTVRQAHRGFQSVQDLLVRMLGNITSSWALCARLSQLQDEGRAEDRHLSLAKAWCTVRIRETVGYARELLGGNHQAPQQ